MNRMTTAATGGGEATARYPWVALGVAFSGVFMAIMDVFVVLVAAPAMRADLHTTAGPVQLVLAGYQVSYAVTLVTGGRLGDRFGRRRMFVAGMAVFVVTSACCGAAPGVGALIVARLAQGVGAALMFPQAFSLIQGLIPAERRGRAFGALGAVIGVSTVVGQVLGGALVQADIAGLSWRPVFLINVPIGIVALCCAGRCVPESARATVRLDLRGAAVLAAALALLIVPLVRGRELGWPWWCIACLVLAAPAAAGFVVLQRRVLAAGGAPLVDPTLFAVRSFRVGLALVLLWYSALNSFFLVLSLMLQSGRGYSALLAGVAYTPVAAAFVVASLLARRLGRAAPACGLVLAAAGFGGCAALPGVLPVWLTVLGLGMGLFQTPLLDDVLAGVRPVHVGTASGVLATAQQVGGALGVAVIGLVFAGALLGGYQHAFGVAVCWHAGIVLACLATLSRLPRRDRAGTRDSRS